jgi:hypothetical protein
VDCRGFSYGFRPGRSPHQALDAMLGTTEQILEYLKMLEQAEARECTITGKAKTEIPVRGHI